MNTREKVFTSCSIVIWIAVIVLFVLIIIPGRQVLAGGISLGVAVLAGIIASMVKLYDKYG